MAAASPVICYNTHAVTKYEQLIETLKTDILGGKYSRTEPIPSVRALMRRFSLSDSTIGRALDEVSQGGCEKVSAYSRRSFGECATIGLTSG